MKILIGSNDAQFKKQIEVILTLNSVDNKRIVNLPLSNFNRALDSDEVTCIITEEDFIDISTIDIKDKTIFYFQDLPTVMPKNNQKIYVFTSFEDFGAHMEKYDIDTVDDTSVTFENDIIETTNTVTKPAPKETSIPKEKKSIVKEEEKEKREEDYVQYDPSYSEVRNKVQPIEESIEYGPIQGVDNSNETGNDTESLLNRANTIRNQTFARSKWSKNKTIGIWSPLSRIGVTQFTINFAMYLAKKKRQVAVLEAMNNRQYLKAQLNHYTPTPNHWKSFAQALCDELVHSDSLHWTYEGVHWLPLDNNDFKLAWNDEMVYHYVNSTKVFDSVLIDIETGKMKPHTLELLTLLDELWIIVDDNITQLKAWKNYIHQLKNQYNLTIHLIHNKEEAFSKPNILEETLALPILAATPTLNSYINQNNYEIEPILNKDEVMNIVTESYDDIAAHLFGDTYERKLRSKEKGFKKLLRGLSMFATK